MENIKIESYLNEEVNFYHCDSVKLSEFNQNFSETEILYGDKNKIYKFNLRDAGIDSYDRLYVTGHSHSALLQWGIYNTSVLINSPEILFNDKTMSLARYPNGNEYMLTDEVVSEGDTPGFWTDGDITEGIQTPKFKVDDKRIKNWKNAKNAWVGGYWRFDWSDQTMPVSEIDTENMTIKAGLPSAYGVGEGKRFYIYNLIEELDSPGEWYYDFESGNIYIYPYDTNPESEIRFDFSHKEYINISNCKNIEIKGINFIGGRGTAITVNKSNGISLDNCTVKNTAGDGLNAVDCSEFKMENSEFSNTGGYGIFVSGGDLQTLTPSGNIINNCHFYNFGRITKTYAGAVHLSGVGNIVSNCEIHDGPHLAIKYSGNDNKILNNDIYNVVNECADMGAIYAGTSFVARGNVIEGNKIHDISTISKASEGTRAVYLDNQLSGQIVRNNVFYNLDGYGVAINGGRDNIVEGNTFENIGKASIYLAARGLATAAGVPSMDQLLNKSGNIPYNSGAYLKYDNLSVIENDEPYKPKYNVFKNNAFKNSEKGIYLDPMVEWDTGITVPDMEEMNTIFDNITY